MAEAQLTQEVVEPDVVVDAIQSQLTQSPVEPDVIADAVQVRLSQLVIEVDAEIPPPPPPPTSTVVRDTVGKRLGCGDYRAFIQSIGGETVYTELNWSSLSYSRHLDDMTEASVIIGLDQTEGCWALMDDLEPFAFELSIWRDGHEAWVGPITEPIFTPDGATIAARDVFQWLERRLLKTNRTFASVDVSDIAAVLFADAIDQDPSPNISITVNPTGVLASREVAGALLERASDRIRELARTGLDFTAVARTLRFGGAEIATPTLVVLTADIFEVEQARQAGLSVANDVWVTGSSGGGVSTPVTGQAGGQDTPLVSQRYSEPDILDTASATNAAETRRDLLRRAPFAITGLLLEEAPVPFEDLVPGARVKVAQQVGFRRIIADMRLLGVSVDAAGQETGVTEAVRLALEPEGTIELVGQI